MNETLVVGAGPAGMSAALELLARGMSVTVVDDQRVPGGRIFAAIEQREAHGAEDRGGAALVNAFRRAGGTYLPGADIWQIETGFRVFLTQDGRARMLEAEHIVLATGAQERPMAFPGWQLPGVMTVGAAQIALKTAHQIPDRPVWLAGTGPLLLLYAHQLQAAGGSVAGILDTAPATPLKRVAGLIGGALSYGWRDLLRGAGWLVEGRGRRSVRKVVSLEAVGDQQVEAIRYRTRDGTEGQVEADLLLIHDGVVPSVHMTRAIGCEHRWNETQRCFEPVMDSFGQTTVHGLFVAGDGAAIGGGRAAALSGRLAGIGVARRAGLVGDVDAVRLADPIRRSLAGARRFRTLVDALYPPTSLEMPDDTMVCRCEEVTAGTIRAVLADRPHMGPDGVKIVTRCGMGPCQGRQCGLNLSRLVAETHGQSPEEIGLMRVQPPLKPLTLGELAALEAA